VGRWEGPGGRGKVGRAWRPWEGGKGLRPWEGPSAVGRVGVECWGVGMGIHDIFMLVPVRVRWWVVLAGLFVGSVLGLGACALVIYVLGRVLGV
jgi:hypothetical protein